MVGSQVLPAPTPLCGVTPRESILPPVKPSCRGTGPDQPTEDDSKQVSSYGDTSLPSVTLGPGDSSS